MSDRLRPRPAPTAPLGRALLTAVLTAATATSTATLVFPAAPVTAATPSPSALPPTVACAGTVSDVVSGRTTAPTPLPAPTGTVGGATLSVPGLHVDLTTGTPRPPMARATAWVVADLSAGAVVAACNAHVPLAPASTLKVLTVLALAHRLDWRAGYVGRPADPATDGSKVGIVAGAPYTVGDLFHGLMLSSGNDAATALATVAGGMPRTAELMNARARQLGALDTHAVNASGLDAPGQVSSAYDLALLGRALLDDPLLARLVATKTYTFPGRAVAAGKRPTYQIQNHNRLLSRYPGATGVKNGYTTAAGGSFVGSATRDGHTYLVTVLRARGRTSRVAERLLDWAFAAGPAARPVGRLVDPGQATASVDPSGTTAAGRGPAATGGGTLGGLSVPGGPASAYAAGALLVVAAAVLVRRRRARAGRTSGDHRSP